MNGLLYSVIPFIAALAAIPPLLLGKKGKYFALWYLYALLLFPFAMIHAIVQKEKNSADIFELRDIIQKVLEPPVQREESGSFVINDQIRYFDPLSPVEVEQVSLKINPVRREVECKLSFRNLGDKEIKAIKLDLFCYNAFGEEEGPPMEVLVQDCTGIPGMIFGPRHYIILEDREHTRRVNAVLRRIVYSDGLLWEAKQGNLRSSQVEALKDPAELELLQRQAGTDAICYARKNLDGWVCVCGRINMGGNRVCMRCKRSRDTVLSRFDRREKLEGQVQVKTPAPVAPRESEAKMLNEYEIRQTLSDAGAFANKRGIEKKSRTIAMAAVIVIILALIAGLLTDFTYSYGYYQAKQANRVQSDGHTMLTAAVASGDKEQVEALIAQGASVDKKNDLGQSPVAVALSQKDTEMSSVLLSHGALLSPEQRNTFMQLCSQKGDLAALKQYLASEKLPAFAIDSSDALLTAASAGHDDIVKLFLEYNANIENEDNAGKTALALAVAGGYEDIVKTLVYDGAEVNKADINGELPLIDAAQDGNLPIVKLLIQGGADPKKTNKYGWTAAEAAENFDHDDVVKYLEGLKS